MYVQWSSLHLLFSFPGLIPSPLSALLQIICRLLPLTNLLGLHLLLPFRIPLIRLLKSVFSSQEPSCGLNGLRRMLTGRKFGTYYYVPSSYVVHWVWIFSFPSRYAVGHAYLGIGVHYRMCMPGLVYTVEPPITDPPTSGQPLSL